MEKRPWHLLGCHGFCIYDAPVKIAPAADGVFFRRFYIFKEDIL
jgi:hypothetical protein